MLDAVLFQSNGYLTLGAIEHDLEPWGAALQFDSLVAAWCATQQSATLVTTLQAEGLAATLVNEYSDIAREPQVTERDMLVSVELADGNKAPLTGPAAKFSRTPTSIRRPAPAPGEHTAEVLAEVGVAAEQYEQLRLDCIV